MPSDSRIETALRALGEPIERYRSAVVTTVEEVRGFLSSHARQEDTGDGTATARLGVFAAGRIDVERFTSVLADEAPEEPERLRKVEQAYEILRAISAGGDSSFHVKVKSGTRLRDAVAARWAELGRGFAAARLAGLATVGKLSANGAEGELEPLGFERWNPTERQLAPPLVIELEGADLHAGDLAEFLDGNVKMVLVVNGEMAPAPLVRLITPSTFVLQTAGATGLDRFAAAQGPAVAALVPASAAQFIHDPAGGTSPGARLELISLPAETPKSAVGGTSVRQQLDELEQLKTLAGEPRAEVAEAEAAAAPAAGPVASKVDKLAAWLLSQADLSNVG
ncbi:MAG: hypothetical protein JSV86_16560 [Gemmatimonadota bacterium]|nr:MAG: hypothetical protein JSV86_16560 [Gemmatimonadota bacterium]